MVFWLCTKQKCNHSMFSRFLSIDRCIYEIVNLTSTTAPWAWTRVYTYRYIYLYIWNTTRHHHHHHQLMRIQIWRVQWDSFEIFQNYKRSLIISSTIVIHRALWTVRTNYFSQHFREKLHKKFEVIKPNTFQYTII